MDGRSTVALLLPAALTRAAAVGVTAPWSGAGAARVGLAKFAAIALACAGGFPGGVIFPLFYAAGALAHGAAAALPCMPATVLPALVMCSMAAVQAAVTRTPLSTALMLALSAAPRTDLGSLLPLCIVSSYSAVWTAQLLRLPAFFNYPPSDAEPDV